MLVWIVFRVCRRQPSVTFSPFTFPLVWRINCSLISFISHRIHGIHRFFSLPCDACAGINAAYARGIHRDLTIPNANTAPAESKTFTMATVHFVPLRQGGRAKRRGWIKPLTSASTFGSVFTFISSPTLIKLRKSPFSFLISPFFVKTCIFFGGVG